MLCSTICTWHANVAARGSNLAAAEFAEQTIRDELDVGAHQVAVHADEVDGQRVGEELVFDDDGVADDLAHALFRRFVDEMLEHEAGEVAVQTLQQSHDSAS